MAALNCVDYVTLFSELTPERLIADLKPDVLAKGADYTREQVVGRDIVEAYGGVVELIPLVEGRSTSGLVQAIVERYNNSSKGSGAANH
ncbi:MAG: bifunctional heptose 7-phosphate kinase/heptose 1-phosphate adenyltransferase, partial [Candidatus Tectomicrobia bacterium]|nr:bifunctional heptose 7-phosphate kinase/heptose 1-phosphate adenyltransferase [Candidatus Tectomicrobia bacterium]